MILAGIDIGTNTLRLLVADIGPDSFHFIHSDRRITRLGERLDRSGILSPEAQERTVQALSGFRDALDRLRPAAIRAVGTSALRNASNSAVFISRVLDTTGIAIDVISGEEEARLTLLGVLRAVARERAAPGPAMVIDIGGGSTEIIITDGLTVEESLPLGAVYLTERFITHDPPLVRELERLRNAVRNELNLYRFGEAHCSDLIGTAGTITTLAAMDRRLAEYDPERINGWRLTRESVDGIVQRLAGSTLQERRGFAGLEEGREDIILAGGLIVQEIMEKSGFREMLVSDWGLREGILLDRYDKMVKEKEYSGKWSGT